LLLLFYVNQSNFTLLWLSRQNDRDRAQALSDYKTNVDAKLEIEALTLKLDNIEIEKLDKIIKMLEEMKSNSTR